MQRGHRSLLIVATALALVGAGCSDGVSEELAAAPRVQCPEGSECYDPPRAPGDGGMMKVDAGDFFFNQFAGEVAEGDIAIELVNVAAATTHNIVFEGANTGSDPAIEANGGEEAAGTVNLFSGEYTFYCDIPGHRASGMEGVLTVTPELTDAQEAATALGQE